MNIIDRILTFALFDCLIWIGYKQKHTNLPKIVLKHIQQEDWYEHYRHYFDMERHDSILFSNIHRSNSKDIYESRYRMDSLYR